MYTGGIAADPRDLTRCGERITFDTDAAYDDLYSTVVWRPEQMARLIARELSVNSERPDGDILAAVLPALFDFAPAALVGAVRHRQAEYAG